MPTIWMHIEYGRRLAEEFRGQLSFLHGLEENRVLYQLGCQGPDFLLYHRFLPWYRKSSAARLGDLIHRQSCGPVLIEFWQRTRSLPVYLRGSAQIYFLGFLTHHLLDRNMHPYINWRAGYKQRHHQRFEVALDTVFMKEFKGINTWQTDTSKEIDVGPRLPAHIHDILHQTAMSWFPEMSIDAENWQGAYKDMLLAHKCLYDPAGWKKAIIRGPIHKLFYQPLSAEEEEHDYLNLKHTSWHHSALYSEVRSDSVWDLWDQALEEGRLVFHTLADFISAPTASEASRHLGNLSLVLGNRSYDTGKNCGSNLVNLYAEPIW
ncbi:zinc dependent phospholipase C family protein [Paenibacillus physcomitrellae]|uniref:Phospholipase C/D domain-containing protein n=1 Tax=Paenibacillus physcomitrellae TaxID=1619311 RepID=A0ABQ1GJN1_9BACL|nr:zinc dependent phospholipase C family protein [Paenibacillus physcomitrellae]GGA44973.1 hypothetical protein GCM10010917_32880 [Paenibacillus physcomitrellae]